jgi:hypothetical protein
MDSEQEKTVWRVPMAHSTSKRRIFSLASRKQSKKKSYPTLPYPNTSVATRFLPIVERATAIGGRASGFPPIDNGQIL